MWRAVQPSDLLSQLALFWYTSYASWSFHAAYGMLFCKNLGAIHMYYLRVSLQAMANFTCVGPADAVWTTSLQANNVRDMLMWFPAAKLSTLCGGVQSPQRSLQYRQVSQNMTAAFQVAAAYCT